MWTILGYLVGFGVIAYRFFYMFDAALRNFYDPKATMTERLLFLRHRFWRKLQKFVMDLVLTSGCLVGARLFIAGTASAPVGALAGLLLSISVTAGPWYKDHVKRQYQTA
jgi:hypothetical protein